MCLNFLPYLDSTIKKLILDFNIILSSLIIKFTAIKYNAKYHTSLISPIIYKIKPKNTLI